jgi:hypothetical protein
MSYDGSHKRIDIGIEHPISKQKSLINFDKTFKMVGDNMPFSNHEYSKITEIGREDNRVDITMKL